jgi:hypothetical protein
MRRRRTWTRRTDYGTVILHWILVGFLLIAIATGLRIAAETPDRTWINALDSLLPQSTVWTAHLPAGVGLAAVAIAYVVYMPLAGLWRRVRLDRVRLLGLVGGNQPRWGAINVILYWLFYLTLISQLVTGGLLYLGSANGMVSACHWYGMWMIFAYAALHVLSHLKLGGMLQLLRIFRPARLGVPQKPLDPVDLLALLAEHPHRPTAPPRVAQTHPRPHRPETLRPQKAKRDPMLDQLVPRATATPQPRQNAETARDAVRPRRRSVLHANPLVVAAASAFVGASFLLAIDRETVDTLHIRHIRSVDTPVLDGDTSDAIWRTTPPLYIATAQGGNFDGNGATTIEVRAVHDGTWAYFLFAWDDPTRSLKQLPLKKTADGWHLLHEGYELGDEHSFNEDKFSVMLTTLDVILAGDRTFHAGPTPAAGKPGTLSGRGLHYTMNESTFLDVWQWKATSGGASGWMDDAYIGPPAEPTQDQIDRKTPFRGGFALDPGTANYSDNFEVRASDDYRRPIKPRRLPSNFKAMALAMGKIDLDPNHGESDGARWYMTESESVPYSDALDAQIPVGTIIPGVVNAGEYSGDRADVRCAARWAAGRWALEVARRLDTGSQFDKPITTGTFMRLAAFDHAQTRHTRHVRPIRLEVE